MKTLVTHRKVKNDESCGPNGHPALSPLFVSETALEQASRLFRALGDPARLRLAARLAQSDGCVSELAAVEGEAMSTISQRLRVLRSENIVACTREGKHRTYVLADRHVSELVKEALAHSSETKEDLYERRKQQNHTQPRIDRRSRRRA